MESEGFATRLGKMMEEYGHTGYSLAKQSGVSKSAISLFLSGRRLPTFVVLKALAKALGKSLGDFDDITTQEQVKCK
jgi:transcriptional regulator with XRE-family HTH domain